MTDFNARKRFHYRAQVQRADGEIIEHDVHNFWSPEKDYTLGAIADAAAAELAQSGRRGPKGEMMPHAGLSAHLVA